MELSEEQIAEFKEVFQIFDTDGNGTICQTELGIVLRALGQTPTDEEVQELLQEADTNENGVIEFNEFLTVLIKQMNKPNDLLSEDNLLHAFETFDRDGDGFITAPELKAFFHEIGEVTVTDDESKEMIEAENTSSKGQMDFDEFKKMMMKNINHCTDEEIKRKSLACLKSYKNS